MVTARRVGDRLQLRRRCRPAGRPALAAALTLALAACTSPSPTTPSPASPSAAVASPTPTAVPATPTPVPPSPSPTATPAPTPEPTPPLFETLPREAFSDPTTIDNRYFPLVPGTRFQYTGSVAGDEGRLSHRVIFTVTDMTKVIDGISTRVVYDIDYTPKNTIAEVELAFFAQDDGGTVWLMGEHPVEYEDGKVIDVPTWLSGIQDATAGIIMPAAPSMTARSYSQGWGPAVEFADRARAFELGSKTCVPLGCYEDVLTIDEHNASEPDAHQLKYYAPGIGPVRVGWAGALEESREVLTLERLTQLDAEQLAVLREVVLAFDERARTQSPDVYGISEPLEGP